MNGTEYSKLLHFCLEHDLICLEYHRRHDPNPQLEQCRFQRLERERRMKAQGENP